MKIKIFALLILGFALFSSSCTVPVYYYGNASDLDDGSYLPKKQDGDSAYQSIGISYNQSNTGWQPNDLDESWGMLNYTIATRGKYAYAVGAIGIGGGQYSINIPDYQAQDLTYGFIGVQGEAGGHLNFFNDRVEWRYLQLGLQTAQEMGAYRGVVRRLRMEGSDTSFQVIDLNPTGFNLKVNIGSEIQFNVSRDLRIGTQLTVSGFYTASVYYTVFAEYKNLGGYVRFRNAFAGSDIELVPNGPMMGLYYRF